MSSTTDLTDKPVRKPGKPPNASDQDVFNCLRAMPQEKLARLMRQITPHADHACRWIKAPLGYVEIAPGLQVGSQRLLELLKNMKVEACKDPPSKQIYALQIHITDADLAKNPLFQQTIAGLTRIVIETYRQPPIALPEANRVAPPVVPVVGLPTKERALSPKTDSSAIAEPSVAAQPVQLPAQIATPKSTTAPAQASRARKVITKVGSGFALLVVLGAITVCAFKAPTVQGLDSILRGVSLQKSEEETTKLVPELRKLRDVDLATLSIRLREIADANISGVSNIANGLEAAMVGALPDGREVLLLLYSEAAAPGLIARWSRFADLSAPAVSRAERDGVFQWVTAGVEVRCRYHRLIQMSEAAK